MPKYAVVQLLEQCGRWEAKADGGWMRDYDGGAYHIKWHPGPGAGLLCDTFHVANTVFPEGDRRRNAFFDLEARPVGNNPGTRQADRRQLDIAADFARELARLVIDGRPVLYGSEPNALAVANPLNDERIKREQQDGGAAVLKKLSDSKVAIDKLLADAEKSRIYLRQIHPRLVARVKDIEGLLNRHKEKAIGSGGPDPAEVRGAVNEAAKVVEVQNKSLPKIAHLAAQVRAADQALRAAWRDQASFTRDKKKSIYDPVFTSAETYLNLFDEACGLARELEAGVKELESALSSLPVDQPTPESEPPRQAKRKEVSSDTEGATALDPSAQPDMEEGVKAEDSKQEVDPDPEIKKQRTGITVPPAEDAFLQSLADFSSPGGKLPEGEKK